MDEGWMQCGGDEYESSKANFAAAAAETADMQ